MGLLRHSLRTAARASAALLVILAAAPSGRATSADPLFDFQSAPLTSDFRQTYPAVGEATVSIDIPYGLDDAQKYDVYLPPERNGAPIIVMIHGGDWASGDKQDAGVAESKAGYWVAKGYVFVSINYRLLPRKDPLVQAADVALAIASIQKNAPNWGADRGKIVLMGAGAGGHLAALLSSNPSLASDQGATAWLGAVVLDTPALNIPAIMSSSHDPVYDTAFGSNVEYWEDSSPADLLASSAVPMLVVCSTENAQESCAKASAFAQRAGDSGALVSVSPQAMASDEVSARLGAEASYTRVVDDFISSLM